MPDKTKSRKILKALEKDSRDLFFFSAEISHSTVNSFLPVILDAKEKRGRDNASLILTTGGGDVHHAYRLVRMFHDLYAGPESFRLVVLGPCKSAGTLVAVGAGELAMGPFGELGPLDVQLTKRDEIALQASGLDTLGALETLQRAAFDTFETYMVSIIQRSRGTVSTKTACNIAATIVSGLLQPIASQIDPHQLSEVERMMEIALKYGELLGTPNLKDKRDNQSLKQLIEGYPTHEFIIDRQEAEKIFATVRRPTKQELVVYNLFPNEVEYEDETIRDVSVDLETIVGDDDSPIQEFSEGDAGAVKSKKKGERTPSQREGREAPESVAQIGPNGREQTAT